MAITDMESASPSFDPASLTKNYDDGVPYAALSRLPALHGEASRNIYLSRFLARPAQKWTERDDGQGRACVRTLGMSWQFLFFYIGLDSYPAFKVTSGGYPTLATTRAF